MLLDDKVPVRGSMYHGKGRHSDEQFAGVRLVQVCELLLGCWLYKFFIELFMHTCFLSGLFDCDCGHRRLYGL